MFKILLNELFGETILENLALDEFLELVLHNFWNFSFAYDILWDFTIRGLMQHCN